MVLSIALNIDVLTVFVELNYSNKNVQLWSLIQICIILMLALIKHSNQSNSLKCQLYTVGFLNKYLSENVKGKR